MRIIYTYNVRYQPKHSKRETWADGGPFASFEVAERNARTVARHLQGRGHVLRSATVCPHEAPETEDTHEEWEGREVFRNRWAEMVQRLTLEAMWDEVHREEARLSNR